MDYSGAHTVISMVNFYICNAQVKASIQESCLCLRLLIEVKSKICRKMAMFEQPSDPNSTGLEIKFESSFDPGF